MRSDRTFSEVLNVFVERDGRNPGQLSRKSKDLFGEHHGIPKVTIVRWLKGDVKRPRHWQDVVKIAVVLRLSPSEADELLTSAGKATLAELGEKANDAERKLLAPLEPILPPFQVPADIVDFTGRTAEINALRAALQDGKKQRICCVIGMAGVGKTSLAIHLAYQFRSFFPDGVLWARLDTTDTLTILHTFAETYGYDVTSCKDLNSRSNRVRQILADKRALIILDNAERDSEVCDLLPPKGPCAVLITTRHQDLSVSNTAYRLELQPFNPNRGESLAFFAHVLGETKTKSEQKALIELADLLGQLPLALSVAAYRIKLETGWTVGEFLARMRQDQRRLPELRRGDQNVHLSFDLSYDFLVPALQSFFAALTVFAGEDFDLPAVAAVTDTSEDETKDALRKLNNLSLVRLGRENRFRLHPLMRDYGREKLTDLEPAQRMVTYFLEYAQRHEQDFSTLDVELGNLLAALQMVVEQNRKSDFIAGILTLYPFLKARGLYEIAEVHLRQAEQFAREELDTIRLAATLNASGHLAVKQGQYLQAGSYYQEALALVRQLISDGSPVSFLPNLLSRLGALAHRQGQFDQANGYYQEALTLAQQAADEAETIKALNNLGLVAPSRGLAHAHYRDALLLARQSGFPEDICTVLIAWGEDHLLQKEWSEATKLFEEAQQHAQEANLRPQLAKSLYGLARIAAVRGNLDEARRLGDESKTIFNGLGHKRATEVSYWLLELPGETGL